MSKFKIEHGASKVNLVLLKTNIEDIISADIDLLAAWSNNERKYIVNELLRFALAQEEDFQKHKVSFAAPASRSISDTKTVTAAGGELSDGGKLPEPALTSAMARA